MYLEKIKTDGLSHLSYILGSDGQAAVIDPRRDCDIYLERARARGLEITHIFETHRNEDLISGAPALAAQCDAKILHGYDPKAPVAYADTAREGDRFSIGQLRLEILETPGHTDDHIAIVIHDTAHDDGAVGVFTGDALFVGDVGRTDFYPDRAEEVAGLLFDSLRKILALGDQAIIYPAHGAGSVCGSAMAEREFSTVGHERQNNPKLQIAERDAFVREKLGEVHYQPPYFRLMERANVEGWPAAPRVLAPRPLTLDRLDAVDCDVRVDVRDPESFAAGHLPGCVCLPKDMIPAFAGWFIKEGQRVALIANTETDLRVAMAHLVRMGLDDVVGGYSSVINAIAAGHDFRSLPTIGTEQVRERLEDNRDTWTLLDVRAADEVKENRIEGAAHIYAGELNEAWTDLDPGRAYTVMCASGKRATIAASWLASKGFGSVDIYLGSMGAWTAAQD
ncbi:MBL fold metallo-hydrolase [Hyphobacterium marinum]|uniref:Rhodanese-like domain-containing protein n=1 Tax=Hyphobacterium marinum TaxID=3116574 RepID=A0ABU7LWG5_9PROT|nr:rhodanese-like domain-containing protein [Hyphobacterium sp. Y6023]MEE2565896.1 rhodanese-like domain-containing protein [Hyphobacterium sp. Y6023]